ncbi:DUF4405 domain-containing protein [Testudinibacter sp. P27/CKL/0425]
MPKKYAFQLLQDLLLTALLLSLMGYHLFAEPIHEWLGLAFLLLICSHNGLNFWWFKRLFHGNYSAYHVLQTALNAILLLLFIAATISGIMLSKHIFAEFSFHSTSDLMRKIHMLSVHWIQIVIAVHLGLHWKALSTLLAPIFGVDLGSVFARFVLPTFWLGISLYGFAAFLQRDLFPYLINQVDFAFFDHSESLWRFYLDFLAMLISFAYSTRILVWLCFFRNIQVRS